MKAARDILTRGIREVQKISAAPWPSGGMHVLSSGTLAMMLRTLTLAVDAALDVLAEDGARRPVSATRQLNSSSLYVACSDGTVWNVDDGKAWVVCVIPGTPAAERGVQEGDTE